MNTIAVIGAGPGLGVAAARRFGREGYNVALVARDEKRVEALARVLRDEGVDARGYAASVRDPEALTGALSQASQDLGPIEVLQYSPVPHQEFMRPVLDTEPASLAGAIEFSIYGPLVATRHVLDGMRALGTGTILFVNGGSAVRPNRQVAGTSIAFAGESAYGQMLHDELVTENIYVGQLIIPGAITPGDPTYDPAVLAELLWQMHVGRDGFRRSVHA